jgi:hypothetical protein
MMKDAKKNKEEVVEKKFGMTFTIDESLNKYKGPEFEPPKLKEIQKKFSKGIIIHR